MLNKELELNMSTSIAIDIGGTAVKGAYCQLKDSSVSLSNELTVAHSRNDIKNLVATVNALVNELHKKGPVNAIGISTTGSVRRNGVVARGAFFSGYEEFSWAEHFQGMGIRVPVRVLNDGHAATLGSFVGEYGAKPDPFALFAVGTGIGGGFVVGGQLVFGSHGFAGAFGHIKVRLGGDQPCICGRSGCVENVGSGRALVAKLRGPDTSLQEVNQIVQDLHKRLQTGDKFARSLFKEIGRALGLAIGDVANFLDPEIITLSGGIVAAAVDRDGVNHFLEGARESALQTCMPRIATHLRIEQSRLTNPNLIGAAVFALRGGSFCSRVNDHLSHVRI
jgi:glucokinase